MTTPKGDQNGLSKQLHEMHLSPSSQDDSTTSRLQKKRSQRFTVARNAISDGQHQTSTPASPPPPLPVPSPRPVPSSQSTPIIQQSYALPGVQDRVPQYPSQQEEQYYSQPPVLHQFYSSEPSFDSPPSNHYDPLPSLGGVSFNPPTFTKPYPYQTVQVVSNPASAPGSVGSPNPTVWQTQPPSPTYLQHSLIHAQQPQQIQQSHQQQIALSMANGYLLPGQEDESDEVIPTAIVVKNIPFSLPREQVITIMESLALSPPYAFNYHYDLPPPGSSQPVFRGLAFANFRTPQETSAALAALNGYEIQGRRLRVEYKRVLRHGEKEKIEREKAIKRMRSAVGLNSSPAPGSIGMNPPPMPTLPPAEEFGPMGMAYPNPSIWHSQAPPPRGLGHIITSPQQLNQNHASFIGSPASNSVSTPSQLAVSSPGSSDLDAQSVPDAGNHIHGPGSGSSSAASGTPKAELDMNDSQTLEIYSRILLFKDDNLRDELAFARSLTGHQRRVVHLVAQRLGLDSRSVGDNDDRFVVVYKGRPQDTEGSATSSSANFIRGKKSMPDMRSATNSPSLMNGGSPSLSSSLGIRKSSTDLKSSPSNKRVVSQPFNGLPPVPPIPSVYDDQQPGSPTIQLHGSPRQARGTLDASHSRGFAGRSGANNWRTAT